MNIKTVWAGGDSRRDSVGTESKEHNPMADRIDVAEARRKVTAGEALLVCAYEDASKCDRIKLDGATSFAQFQTLADSLPKDKPIIFYCA